jgi:hypothetical protein
MELSPQIIPTLESGDTRVTATLQDPIVTLSTGDPETPTVCIEEGAVLIELEFPAPECLARFKARVAALHPLDDEPRRGARTGRSTARRGSR